MQETEPSSENAVQRDANFYATHWSVVALAGDSASPRAHDALAKLFAAYWYPLYAFVRRQGNSPEDAQDLVQGFLARVAEKNYLADVDREKGSFRSFLLMALKRFMANEWDRANRQKRGGGQEFVSLDEQNTEMRYQNEPADESTPEKEYERRWAMTLFERVLNRLQAEFAATGKAHLFAELKIFLSGDKSGRSYAEIGPQLGLTEGAIKVVVHRLRQRYRELLRAEIGATVGSPETIDDEIRHLFAALS